MEVCVLPGVQVVDTPGVMQFNVEGVMDHLFKPRVLIRDLRVPICVEDWVLDIIPVSGKDNRILMVSGHFKESDELAREHLTSLRVSPLWGIDAYK
jgi:hypothetical protein